MSNTPCAYAVCSVLHRSVEFKADSRPPDNQSAGLIGLLTSKAVLKGNFRGGIKHKKLLSLARKMT
jgi:hypothetical protein